MPSSLAGMRPHCMDGTGNVSRPKKSPGPLCPLRSSGIMKAGGPKVNRIFVVSDGTGRTAQQALDAALVQFPGAEVEIVVRPNVRTASRARAIVAEAAKAGGFIVHT